MTTDTNADMTAGGPHTLVVQMSLDPERQGEIDRHLREDVAGWAASRPGFVSGQWLRQAGGTRGFGVIVFASRGDAEAAAAGPRGYRPDHHRAWNVDAVDVYGQVAAVSREVP